MRYLKPFHQKFLVKGLIPMDNAMKYAPENEAPGLNDCVGALATEAGIDAGVYHSDWGAGTFSVTMRLNFFIQIH